MNANTQAVLNIPLPFKQMPRLSIDYVLLLLVAVLLAVGLIILSSASITLADARHDAPFFFVQRQLQAVVLGLVGGVFMAGMPTSVWRHTGFVLLVFALGLLVLVLVPGVGTTVNGSTRWLNVAGIVVQVSEPARLAIMLYIAGYCVRQQQELRTRFAGLMRPMVVLTLVAALLLAEPDFGAATVLLATTLTMLFVAGARLRDFCIFALAALLALATLAVTSQYRMKRLTAFLNPWDDPYDSGFQLTQSLIAIGRGEWFGVGLGESVQKLFYLPEAHTDFVFAVFAEEFGLLGVVLLIVLILTLILRIFSIARRAADKALWFQAYVAFGIGTWLGLQAFINIGVNIGLLPTKGLTLPLVSYGRSSMIVVLSAIGLLLRIHHETRTADEIVVKKKRSKRS